MVVFLCDGDAWALGCTALFWAFCVGIKKENFEFFDEDDVREITKRRSCRFFLFWSPLRMDFIGVHRKSITARGA